MCETHPGAPPPPPQEKLHAEIQFGGILQLKFVISSRMYVLFT